MKKIKEVKTYQSVKFHGAQESFFSNQVRGMQDLEILTMEWGILLRTEREEVVVSFNNIAYAKYEKELPSETKKSKGA